MAAVVAGMGLCVSCSKEEETPAEEINNTTQALEGEAAALQEKAVELKKDADSKATDLTKQAKAKLK